MKVAILNSVYNVGSTGKIVSGLHKIIKLRGLNSIIIYGRGKKVKKDTSIHFVSYYIETFFHVLMTRLLDRHGLHSYFTTKRICHILENEKPDIIHLHNIHGYFLNLNIFFKFLKMRNIPVIWTLHDCWTFTGHCAYFDKVNCNKWQTECNKCPQLNSYPKSFITDRSKDNFYLKRKLFNAIPNLYIIGVSEWISNHVKKSFLSQKLYGVIYNGVDTNIFFPRDISAVKNKYKLNDKFILLSVAKIWEPRKGLEDLFTLINALPENFVLLIVGRVLSTPKFISDRVIYFNDISNQDSLAELYSVANLFINLSTEDNLPMTLIESLACGTNVISYDTGGCSEVISDKFGKVFTKGDLDGILNYIKHNYQYFNNKMYIDNVNEIKNKFSQDIQYQKYVDLYINKIKKN